MKTNANMNNYDYIVWLQQALNRVDGLKLDTDGIIGAQTLGAIKRFQSHHGLDPDGILGPKTEAALRAAGADPVPPITLCRALAAEQWLPTVVPLLEKHRGAIPLDFLLGWISVESGGALCSYTYLGERGYFQLMPEESATVKADHARLSRDPEYSVQKGIELVRHYQPLVEKRRFRPAEPVFWPLVKLQHAIGPGDADKIFADMSARGVRPGTWPEVDAYMRAQGERIVRERHTKADDLARFATNVSELVRRGQELLSRWRALPGKRPAPPPAPVTPPRPAPSPAPPRPAGTPAPRTGTAERGSPEYVQWAQGALNKILSMRLDVDGDLGAHTREAIRAFQRKQGIDATGGLGEKTEAAMIAAGAGDPPVVAPPTAVGIDTNVDTRKYLSCLRGATWKGLPVSFVVRYYSFNPEKNLSRAEAQALSQAGFRCAVVWETVGGYDGFYTRVRGTRDGREAFKQGVACGQVSGTPIYFAVDNYDPSTNSQRQAIAEYFEGVRDGLAQAAGDAKLNPRGVRYGIGVYATRRVLAWCRAQGIVTWFWQSCSRLTSGGTNQYRWPQSSMHQVTCEKPLCASCSSAACKLSVDFNESYGQEGSWRVPVSAPRQKEVSLPGLA
jgi:peptidoglycan hydrolase-like protein with peptidoglycan-binding domain